MIKEPENKEVLSIKDLTMNDIIPNIVDDVIIKMNNYKIEKYLPSDMGGDRYRRWMNGKGGVFFKDAKDFSKQKLHGSYALVTYDDNSRAIIRLINDEENESFSILADGKIKDRQYIIMRTLSDTDELSSTMRVTKHEDPIELYIEPKEETETENESTNVPLFGDS